MDFDLSEDLFSAIVFSMENQSDSFVLDSVEKKLVKKVDSDLSESDRFYRLPEWNSMDGFRLMERFMSALHNPLAKNELKRVLASGRGVFRNFKDTLKNYPEVERLWFSFKEKEMRQVIVRWYNALRDAWGLERIGEEPEEIDDIVHDDFHFREYDDSRDREALAAAVQVLTEETAGNCPDNLGPSFVCMWQNVKLLAEHSAETAFIAETNAGDFAGYIAACPVPADSRQTVLIHSLFVLPPLRGLGIAKELLSLCIGDVYRCGFRRVIMGSPLLPDSFIPALSRFGFRKCGSVCVADLSGFSVIYGK